MISYQSPFLHNPKYKQYKGKIAEALKCAKETINKTDNTH